jgi:thiopurine S-methyltransferase
MERAFWEQRWETGQIGFHEGKPNRFLAKFVAQLPPGRVLVPLAGKTFDLDLLEATGREVTAVELVERAVHEYFAERGGVPEPRRVVGASGGFEVYERGRLRFVRGDVLEHQSEPYDAVFDRAATIALPVAVRQRYATHLATLVRAEGAVLLVSLEHDATVVGPPFSVDEAEVDRLYAPSFQIEELESEDVFADSRALAAKGATRVRERVYLLRRRS